MNAYDKPGDPRPLHADARLKFIHLTPKQKRMLWIAASGLIVIVAGIAIFNYINSAPERGRAEFQEAMRMMKPGNYDLAVQGFTKALKTWPQLSEAYLQRGNALHNLGRDDEALADLERATDLDPSLYRAFVAIGSIYSSRHQYQRAMEAYSSSIRAKPNTDAYYERGQTYESMGEHQKAVEDYNRALMELPNSPAVLRARGLARRNLGDEAGYQSDRDAAWRIEHPF